VSAPGWRALVPLLCVLMAVGWLGGGLLVAYGRSLSADPAIAAGAWSHALQGMATELFFLIAGFAVAWAIPLHRYRPATRVALALGGAVAAYLAAGSFQSWLLHLREAGEPMRLEAMLGDLIAWMPNGLPGALARVGAGYAIGYAIRGQRVSSTLASQQLALNRVRLQVLLQSAQPELLLEILDAIAALSRRDPEAAQRLLLRASALLREVSRLTPGSNWRLEQELELVELELEMARVHRGLAIELASEVAPGFATRMVPFRLLHFVVQRVLVCAAGATRIEMRGPQEDDRLTLRIETPAGADDADGLALFVEQMTTRYGVDFALCREAAPGRSAVRLSFRPGPAERPTPPAPVLQVAP
jgi:hypothetical protein